MRVKLKDLNIIDLDVIHRDHGLQIKGKNTSKVNELMTKLGNDEIDTDDYQILEQNASTSIQAQINDLKGTVENLVTMIQTACMLQQDQGQRTVASPTGHVRLTGDAQQVYPSWDQFKPAFALDFFSESVLEFFYACYLLHDVEVLLSHRSNHILSTGLIH